MIPVTIFLASLMFGLTAVAQTAVPLWPKLPSGEDTIRTAPEGDHVVTHVVSPSITLYLPAPATATGAAVIIAPGGGHTEIWVEHEGYRIGEFLSQHGIAAFVLKYRLAREKGSIYTVEGTELGDMQRAIRMVRARSAAWGVDPNRVGVMGFSAGGELAELASTRYDAGQATASDPIERMSSKPDFQALMYPAIPKEPRLTADTPPAFLACGGLDREDISQGLAEFYLDLEKLKVPVELHIYAGIGHGFGIRASNPKPVADWPQTFVEWMGGQGLLKQRR